MTLHLKFKIHVSSYSELGTLYILRTVLCLRGGAFVQAPPLSTASMGEHFYNDSLKIYHPNSVKILIPSPGMCPGLGEWW